MRSDSQKPAPIHAVVEKLKEVIQNPSIIDKFNEDRHTDDQVKNEIDYIATFFGVSYRTIYRRMRKAGVTISKIRRSINDLDVEATIEAYNLKEFQPIEYKIDNDIKVPVSEKTVILGISDIQFGALRNAYGVVDDPFTYTKNYFEILKSRVKDKFNESRPSKLIIALIGDLVDGENIYIGQKVIPIHQQASFVTDLIYDFVQFVSAFGISEIEIQSVRGNHGNLNKYYSKESNWDNVVAEMLKIRYDIHHSYNGYNHVNVFTTKSAYLMFKADKWNVVIHHGDFVKGVFNKGTTAFNTKPIEQHMESMKLTKFKEMDGLLIGHWHRFHYGELLGMNYVVNGTCYESDFVRGTLMGKETMSFVYITVGEHTPFEKVELLHLGDSK